MTQLTEMPENQRSNPVILNIGLPSTVHRKDEHGEAALAPRDFVCAYHPAAWVRIPSTPPTRFQFVVLELELEEKDKNKRKRGRDGPIFLEKTNIMKRGQE